MWIRGTYDETDFDEVVVAATSMVGANQKSPVVPVITAILVKFVEFADVRSQSKVLPREAQSPASSPGCSSRIIRSPPAA